MGMGPVTVSMRKKAAESEAENNKADLLARIDGAIKCNTDNLLNIKGSVQFMVF